MGSSGTGRLSDYTEAAKQPTGEGGASGEDRCNKAFSSPVEELDRCPYVQTHGHPPAIGTQVKVVFNGRPGIATLNDLLIGYLPTERNYLRSCMEAGFSYVGVVTESRRRTINAVTVALAPV